MNQGAQSKPLGIWAIGVIFLSLLVIELIEFAKSIPGFDFQSQLEYVGLVLTLFKLLITAVFVYSLFSLRKLSLFWLVCLASTDMILAALHTLRDGQASVVFVWNQLALFIVYIVVFVYLYLFKKRGVLN